MSKIKSLVICFVFCVLSMGIHANAQDLINPSFESGFVSESWINGPIGSGVIGVQNITPNVLPTDGNFMLYITSSSDFPNGGTYTGRGFQNLATDELINTRVVETNTTIVSSLNFGDQVPSYISYNVSFLAPTDNTCDNYVAVLLLHNDLDNAPINGSIEDAKCYNSTGNGFINTDKGPVSCTQVVDDNTTYTISTNQMIFEYAGRTNFFTDSLPVPVPDSRNRYSIQIVSGQIFDGVCELSTEDTGALFDNFNLLTLNLNGLDPSQAVVQNTISADGFTPNGDVSFIYSFNVNAQAQAEVSTRVAPDDICQGLDTPLVNPRILRTVQADGNGDASFSFNVPSAAAGATVHIQAVDITTCIGSNVNEETIDDSPGGQPPVLLALNPGTAGQQNTLSATDATPKGT